MKIFKSIKWRLQIWYGLILVGVLATLGITAYQLQRQELFGRVDNELHTRVGILAGSLHHPPPHQMPPDFGGPPPGDFPEDGPPGVQRNHHPPDFNLAPENTRFFDPNDPHHFYFIISALTRDGVNEIARSTNQPDRSITTHIAGQLNRVDNLPPGPVPYRAPAFFSYKDCRETLNVLPSGEMIMVGCSITPELYQLQNTALALTGVGAIILFFGLAGGWWISSRAIRPVENISATAVKISAGDLSQRINTAETESELGQLATVLNSTFARLEAAFAQQKQFASDAAHELRTPVSVILTQTQTALNRERDAADYKQTVEACQRAAQRMRKLITALLELARLDAGQEQMKRSRFDFSKTVGDCIELIRPLADERGVKISTELAPLEIEGDSERLGLVVTNLLTNAVQYNHDGGEVKVGAKQENGMAILNVSDTGQGIPAEDLPRVFERFFRADKSRSSGNAGLGLAISKAIVAAHGGSIDVSSEENVGTTFTVHLPALSRGAP
jgi:two-component system, OmpR family, sensor kinase